MRVLAADTVGSPGVNITIFLIFVAITLVVVARASRNNKTASDYYAAGRAFTGPQNGIAISGDYLSAASFLGIAGAIAINGYDGFLYSIGFLVAWLVALLLVAELLRNTGKFTMGDVLSFRMQQKPVRAAAAITTVAVSLFYLIAQMAGAGGLVALLLGVESKSGQNITIAVVGGVSLVASRQHPAPGTLGHRRICPAPRDARYAATRRAARPTASRSRTISARSPQGSDAADRSVVGKQMISRTTPRRDA